MGSRSQPKIVFHEGSYKYIPTSKSFRQQGEKTHGQGRHKAKRPGDSLSFKVPRGRRSGQVVEVHKEHYIVASKGTYHKVNRQSILYSLGTFAGKVRARREKGQIQRETRGAEKRQREMAKTRRKLAALKEKERLLDLKLQAKKTRERVKEKKRKTSPLYSLIGSKKKTTKRSPRKKKPTKKKSTKKATKKKATKKKRKKKTRSWLDPLW